jgi:hypothetical protein
MTLRLCKVCEDWHDLDDWPASCFRPPTTKRSHLSGPMCISDTMEPTLHMADGKHYSSKAQFRAVTRAHGCVEVGNDPALLRPKKKPKPDRQKIKASVERAFSQAGLGAR